MIDATPVVLVIEDDPHSAEVTAEFVREAGATPMTTARPAEALDLAHRLGDRLVFAITDVRLGEDSGLDLFRRLRGIRPDLPVIIVTAFANLDDAVAAMRDGAFYYFTKPVDYPLLLRIVRESLEKRALAAQVADLHARLDGPAASGIVGTSPSLRRACAQAAAVAPLDTTVLLAGETGTGKEVFTRFIHENSPRRRGPLVIVNCAALPDTLLESELFGHERGAFTGAVARKPGRFEQARGGTLFLDEIGELALPLQAKLLRALETRMVEPLGSTRPLAVDVRIVAATNRDLTACVAEGKFREDLFYRLDAFPIQLPPLRDRREDIPVLAMYFLEQSARQRGKAIAGFERAALDAMQAYQWPGNVRELRHYVERAVILGAGREIRLDDLPKKVLGSTPPLETAAVASFARLKDLEREAVARALSEAGGNRTRAARALGMTRNQIRYRLKKLHTEAEE